MAGSKRLPGGFARVVFSVDEEQLACGDGKLNVGGSGGAQGGADGDVFSGGDGEYSADGECVLDVLTEHDSFGFGGVEEPDRAGVGRPVGVLLAFDGGGGSVGCEIDVVYCFESAIGRAHRCEQRRELDGLAVLVDGRAGVKP